ncbi:hypothetical protein [Streptomyces sp. NPDC001089]
MATMALHQQPHPPLCLALAAAQGQSLDNAGVERCAPVPVEFLNGRCLPGHH